MAREFSGPLTADDLVWLRARYTESYVQRQIEVLGTADDEDKVDEAEQKALEEAEKARLEAEEVAAQAGATTGDAGAGDAEEDLIGGGDPAPEAFDVLGSTEPEVKEWVATASPEAKAAALATEQGREDRDPRKGVVSLLS